MAKAVMVISYDLPEDTNEGFAKLSEIARTVRDLFEDKPDVKVHVAIRESADAIINFFEENE
jgi:hypothetical protein